MSAPKFAPKLARGFANDLVMIAAVHAAVGAASGESSGQLLGNFRAVSEQLAGNVSHNADECPRNGSQVTWQFPLKSTPQITQQAGWRQRSSPRGVRLGVRATTGESSRELPGNFRAASGQFRMKREAARKFPKIFHVSANMSASSP
jgi:hypothetical protein